jgi:sugar lactone lactonase YvrE
LYVCDTSNHTIRKITPAGVVTTFAGTAGIVGSTDGTGTNAKFNLPSGITIDSSGNLYVSDNSNHTIRKITPAGVVTTFAGSAGSFGSTDGTGTAARFFKPQGIIIDSSDNLYVCDVFNHTIRKITPAGVVTTIAGTAGSTGSVDGTGTAARFNNPIGITIDSSNNLYVCDGLNHTIRKITPAGVVTTIAGSAGTYGSTDGTGTAARFQQPLGITIDSSNNLYVCDIFNHTIRKITPAGVVTTFAGTAGSTGSVDGTGTAARFYQPLGITIVFVR